MTHFSGGKYNLPSTLRGEFRYDTTTNTYYFRDKDGVTRRFTRSGNVAYLTEISDLNGNKLTIQRDPTTHLITSVYNPAAVAETTLTFSYDTTPEKKLQTIKHLAGVFPGERIWTYTFDTAHNLISVATPPVISGSGLIVQYLYNSAPGSKADGLLKQIILPDGGTVTHTYYPNGRAFQTIARKGDDNADPQGNVQSYQADLYHNRTVFIDERGNRTQHDYDAHGHESRLVMPDRATERSIWANDLLTERTDPFGVTTKFTNYDSLGNVGQVKTGRYVNSTWIQTQLQDRALGGNLVLVDAITTLTYDTPNNGVFLYSKVKKTTLPSSSANARTTENTYDAAGNLTNVSEAIRDSGFGIQYRATDFVYEPTAPHRLTKIVDPRGDHTTANLAATKPYTTEYKTYNAFGQPTEIWHWIKTDPGTGQPVYAIESFAYDAHGYLQSQKDPNGYLGGYQTTYGVDNLGRRTTTTQPAPILGSPQPVWITDYDSMGNIIHTKDAEDRDTNRTYDKLERLIRTSSPDLSVTTVQYDPKGNVVSQSDGLGHVTTYIYDDRDRVVQTVLPDGSTTITRYDGMGQVVAQVDTLGRVTKSNYDQLGRLTTLTEPAPAPQGPGESALPSRIWKYTYDAVGNRVEESLATADAGDES